MSPTDTSLPVLVVAALIVLSSQINIGLAALPVPDLSTIRFVVGVVLAVWLDKFFCALVVDIRREQVTVVCESLPYMPEFEQGYLWEYYATGTLNSDSASESEGEELYAPRLPKRPMPPPMRLSDYFRLYPPRNCADAAAPRPRKRAWTFTTKIGGGGSTTLRRPLTHSRGCIFHYFSRRLLPYSSAPRPVPQPSMFQQLIAQLPSPPEERDLFVRLQNQPPPPPPILSSASQTRTQAPSALNPVVLPPLALPMDVDHDPAPPALPSYDRDWNSHPMAPALLTLAAVNDPDRWYAAFQARRAQMFMTTPLWWAVLPAPQAGPALAGPGAMDIDGW
ncbi:hypothetical protein C8F01DRAFT_1162557 [Mycena amicta]|nr:hypothetical protein C8F01DRAFT_1162557 [Mycena amicta]